MAERTREITRGGKQIVHLDFANFTDVKVALAAIEYARQFIAKYPLGSVRTLTDVTNSRANDEIVNALKGLTKANKPYVKCGAVVGLTAMQRILFKAVMTFSGRNLSAFETVEQAGAWLEKQP
jgi:hypothetical protein